VPIQSTGTGFQQRTFSFMGFRTIPAPQLKRILTHRAHSILWNCPLLSRSVLSGALLITHFPELCPITDSCKVEVKVTLRLAVTVCLDVGPLWFSWPDVSYCLTVTVVSLWSVLSDERSGVSFASQSLQYLVVCESWIYTIPKASVSPGSVHQFMPY
jgi:hypothetical protein